MSMKEEELEFISVVNEEDDGAMTSNSYRLPGNNDAESDQQLGSWIFKQSKHPVALGFHLLFKFAALFLYVFGSWFTSSFILIFVMCTILLAFDFWTVKNVSGRLLVGLRWWSYVRDDGANEWVFESLEDMAEISATDSRIFWTTLYGTPVVWVLLLVVGILRLKFEYIPVIMVALFLNGANAVGYYKCSASAQEKVQAMMKTGSSFSLLDNSFVKNWMVSSLLNVSGVSSDASTTRPTNAQSNSVTV